MPKLQHKQQGGRIMETVQTPDIKQSSYNPYTKKNSSNSRTNIQVANISGISNYKQEVNGSNISNMHEVRESVNANFSNIEQKCKKSHETLIKSILSKNIEFRVDENNSISYVEITDEATNELLRSIPSEAMRNVLEKINEHIDEILNTNMGENKNFFLDTNS